jgi:hypothetical protein
MILNDILLARLMHRGVWKRFADHLLSSAREQVAGVAGSTEEKHRVLCGWLMTMLETLPDKRVNASVTLNTAIILTVYFTLKLDPMPLMTAGVEVFYNLCDGPYRPPVGLCGLLIELRQLRKRLDAYNEDDRYRSQAVRSFEWTPRVVADFLDFIAAACCVFWGRKHRIADRAASESPSYTVAMSTFCFKYYKPCEGITYTTACCYATVFLILHRIHDVWFWPLSGSCYDPVKYRLAEIRDRMVGEVALGIDPVLMVLCQLGLLRCDPVVEEFDCFGSIENAVIQICKFVDERKGENKADNGLIYDLKKIAPLIVSNNPYREPRDPVERLIFFLRNTQKMLRSKESPWEVGPCLRNLMYFATGRTFDIAAVDADALYSVIETVRCSGILIPEEESKLLYDISLEEVSALKRARMQLSS